jgi:hypothetical protein
MILKQLLLIIAKNSRIINRKIYLKLIEIIFSNETYEKGNGWIEIFKPLLTLEYKDRSELYALFTSIRNRYIPR